jgi:hypothetical protein
MVCYANTFSTCSKVHNPFGNLPKALRRLGFSSFLFGGIGRPVPSSGRNLIDFNLISFDPQDEVICISEKVVLKVTDLLTWIVDDVKWERGACASTDGGAAAKWPTSAAAPLLDSGLPDGAEFHGGFLDMRDVIKEKQLTGMQIKLIYYAN